jgi:hypothetical protein
MFELILDEMGEISSNYATKVSSTAKNVVTKSINIPRTSVCRISLVVCTTGENPKMSKQQKQVEKNFSSQTTDSIRQLDDRQLSLVDAMTKSDGIASQSRKFS